MRVIASIAFLKKSRNVDQIYSYYADASYCIGQLVKAPLGRGSSEAMGVIVNIEKTEDETKELKSVSHAIQKEPVITPMQLEVCRKIAEDSLCDLTDAIQLFIPYHSTRLKKSKTKEPVLAVQLSLSLEQIFSRVGERAHKKRSILQDLEAGPTLVDELIKKHGSTTGTHIRELLKNGVIESYETSCPFKWDDLLWEDGFRYHREQAEAIDQIERIRRWESNRRILLHGVTGSGKTEIYIQILQNTIDKGQQGIVLVPEISLSEQLLFRFRQKFGNRVAFFHSRLSELERKEQWQRMEEGKCDLVVGARSALYSPLHNIGCIIVDECHESSYFSEQTPKISAIRVAEFMSKEYSALLILGSATPTTEQFYQSQQFRYHYLSLNNRVRNTLLPEVEMVDMLDEWKKGNGGLFSEKLLFEMQQCLDQKKQILLFLNRRGYANALNCENCGHTFVCPGCKISLTYHKSTNDLQCHYCSYTIPYPHRCPDCGHHRFLNLGYGTESIESDLKKHFPGVRTIRMDKDTTGRKNASVQMIESFQSLEADILLGTQMIGKGFDFPNLHLVGILNADLGLQFPDFRAEERCFALLEQVIGRAGRSHNQGKAIIQSFQPNLPIFSYIQKHDYLGFYESDIAFRKLFYYPPFSNLLKIVATDRSHRDAADSLFKFKQAFLFYQNKTKHSIELLGPSSCFFEKKKGYYRWQIILKATTKEEWLWCKKITKYIVDTKKRVISSADTSLSYECNPISML